MCIYVRVRVYLLKHKYIQKGETRGTYRQADSKKHSEMNYTTLKEAKQVNIFTKQEKNRKKIALIRTAPLARYVARRTTLSLSRTTSPSETNEP